MQAIQSEHKIVITNWTPPPPLPDNIEEELWNMLERSIHSIRKGHKSSITLPYHMEELYRASERLCLLQFQSWTHDRLYKECKDMANEIFNGLIQKSGSLSTDIDYLQLIQDIWSDYTFKYSILKNMFYYLDRTYMTHTPDIIPLWNTGMELFKTIILTPDIRNHITKCLISLFETIRISDSNSDSNLLLKKQIIDILYQLNIYDKCFEEPFLSNSREYYTNYSNSLIETKSNLSPKDFISSYLNKVNTCLEKESQQMDNLSIATLHPNTKSELLKDIEDHLIRIPLEQVLSVGFESLLEIHENHSLLELLYMLVDRVKSFDILKIHLGNYIKKKGSLILSSSNEFTIIEQVIQFKQSLDNIIITCFHRCEPLQNALKESFETFLNNKSNKSAEWIAKYLDMLLCAPNYTETRQLSQKDLDSKIDQILTLFRFIQGKDIFEAFFKKDLAKRLLLGKSTNLDVEKGILSGLKAECGPAFTSKLEGMFKDIELSKELDNAFQQSIKYVQKIPSGLEIQPFILTAGFWPSYGDKSSVVLPKKLKQCQQAFEQFYLDKHNGRRLAWQHNLEHCIVKANMPSGVKLELCVSLYQAAVLNCFTKKRIELSVNDIIKSSGLDYHVDNELERIILSLTNSKHPILIVKGKSDASSLSLEDIVCINENFTSKHYRVVMHPYLLTEEAIDQRQKEQEASITMDQVYQDRHHQMDAAIVRIMKSAQVMSNTQLMTELFSILKFPIRTVDLKKRIDSLIGREFLQRDKDNPQLYRYLA